MKAIAEYPSGGTGYWNAVNNNPKIALFMIVSLQA